MAGLVLLSGDLVPLIGNLNGHVNGNVKVGFDGLKGIIKGRV